MPALDANERNRLRRKLGLDEIGMPDAHADDLLDEAESLYPDNSRGVQFACAVWEGRKELHAQASAQVTFSEGESSQNLSDIAKALAVAVEQDRKRLEALIQQDAGASFRMGKMARKPRRWRDAP